MDEVANTLRRSQPSHESPTCSSSSGSETSNKPGWPMTANGSIGRIVSNTQENAPSYFGQHASGSSNTDIGRQSIKFTMASACPAGAMSGVFDDTMRRGPRYDVFHVLVSIDFSPDAIMLAHGCFTEIAFIAAPPLRVKVQELAYVSVCCEAEFHSETLSPNDATFPSMVDNL